LALKNDSLFSIIIVTHNSQDVLERCFYSIINSCRAPLEIIVIDNASSDDTRRLIQKQNSLAKIQLNEKNVGYGSACNQGASMASGRYLFFCNSDIEVLNDICSLSVQHLENKAIGCLGPRILKGDNNTEAPFSFKFPHPPIKLFGAYLRSIFGKSKPKILQINIFNNSTLLDCDWILGAALLMRYDLFERVGGFDETFFLYFEEIDLCKRLKSLGYKIISDRRLAIKHQNHGSSEYLSMENIMKIRYQSECRYYQKHHGSMGHLSVKLLDKNVFLFRA